MVDSTQTVPKRMKMIVDKFGDRPALWAKDQSGDFVPTSFHDMWERVRAIGTGLLELGVARDQHIGLMSDNRMEWFLLDQAILSIGAVDVPRGSDSTPEEMAYILNHADCELSIAENLFQAEKILSQRSAIPRLETLIVIDDGDLPKDMGKAQKVRVLGFADIEKKGNELLSKGDTRFDGEFERGGADDLATFLYTSGTTGEPKGVMLTHRNFLFQMNGIKDKLFLTETDIFLSVLPVWHSFERAVEYICLDYGSSLAYSKPIGQIMLADMAQIRPTWMTSVPRIWEGVREAIFRNVAKSSSVKKGIFRFFVSVGKAHAGLLNRFRGLLPDYKPSIRFLDILISTLPLLLLWPLRALGEILVFKKLKDRLGGRFNAGVSGGGALPPYVDSFFQAAGIKLLEGYGLTETAPIIAVRNERAPEYATVGSPLKGIQYRVLGEDGSVMPPGRQGELWVKSEQIMRGYYKKPDETAAVMRDGWLNTGDIAVFTHSGAFKILGRTKETIVLMGGENIEPVPIEDKLCESSLISQVMVVGQDQRYLGALVVPSPNGAEDFAKDQGIEYSELSDIASNEDFRSVLRTEIDTLVGGKTGFKPFERIGPFAVLETPFEVGSEMTRTMKKKRDVISTKYEGTIAGLFRK